MDQNAETRRIKRARFSLSQETITILTVGVALAGVILVNQGDMRAEARADRHKMHAEARADRARTDAALNVLRAEARADREAFAKQITPTRGATGDPERFCRGPRARHRHVRGMNAPRSPLREKV